MPCRLRAAGARWGCREAPTVCTLHRASVLGCSAFGLLLAAAGCCLGALRAEGPLPPTSSTYRARLAAPSPMSMSQAVAFSFARNAFLSGRHRTCTCRDREKSRFTRQREGACVATWMLTRVAARPLGTTGSSCARYPAHHLLAVKKAGLRPADECARSQSAIASQIA